MPQEKAKRAYRSTRRQEQARETRRQIIAAARALFFENGYSGTSIEAIAKEAGVAPETIYASFGSKLAVLTALVQVSVVGDDLPIPLLERPEIRAAQEIMDQRVLIRKFAADIAQIMQRMSPVFALLRTTAKSEPEIAAIQERVLKDRLHGVGFMVENLQRIGPLHPDLILTQAAETVWAVSSAEVFDLFTLHRGWSIEQYQHWLEQSLGRLLLP